jgi:DegV family protein with EDD domain
MAVRVVTDSTAYLDPGLVDSFAIERVSLSVIRGDDAREELAMDDLGAFYRQLHDIKDLPTTSQPSVGQFLEVYRPILDAGDEIVSVHLSAAISGTCDSASQARDQLERDGFDPARVRVIDSQGACGGLSLQVMAAATAAARGGGLEDAAAASIEMRERMSFWFVVDTLEYLRRGGRIGAAQALIGGAIKIKPILTVGEQGITPVDKVRTQSRALDRLMAMAIEAAPERTGFAVQHIQAPELAGQVADRCREQFGGEPLFSNEIGPVIGAHVGPGLIGLAIFPDEMIDRP